MNGLERRYAEYLEARKRLGEIADWRFDRIKIRIAHLCYITVDFAVMLPDGVIEFHETKGFMEGDALVKLKAVAEEFWWFRFVLVKALPKRDGGGFSFKEIECPGVQESHQRDGASHK
jgi:hypothetical protein